MFRRASILAVLVLAGSCLRADDTGGTSKLSVAEYRAELRRLLAVTQQLNSSTQSVPAELKDLPWSWQVHTERQDFEIPAEALRQDVRDFEKEKSADTATAIRSRIQSLSRDLEGFQAVPPDDSLQRQRLAAILARPEFRDVNGPSFMDRLVQRLIGAILRVLEAVFGSSAVPLISRFVVYGLIGLALWALGFLMYRYLRPGARQNLGLEPAHLPLSAKVWTLWLAEARAAAANHNWREAVHLAYWGGISFLEQRGTWRPDRARTPREYLRLLSSSSEHRETLAALTRIFELTWYANQGADAATFSRTMEALERLGCHSQ